VVVEPENVRGSVAGPSIFFILNASVQIKYLAKVKYLAREDF
jgi:hypothetical protein